MVFTKSNQPPAAKWSTRKVQSGDQRGGELRCSGGPERPSKRSRSLQDIASGRPSHLKLTGDVDERAGCEAVRGKHDLEA